eukprot:scaffold16457_cov109-Isochrysis_galbana.AAC.2
MLCWNSCGPRREEVGREGVGREEVGREEVGREEVGLGREGVGREEVGREEVGREEVGREDVRWRLHPAWLAAGGKGDARHVSSAAGREGVRRGASPSCPSGAPPVFVQAAGGTSGSADCGVVGKPGGTRLPASGSAPVCCLGAMPASLAANG